MASRPIRSCEATAKHAASSLQPSPIPCNGEQVILHRLWLAQYKHYTRNIWLYDNVISYFCTDWQLNITYKLWHLSFTCIIMSWRLSYCISQGWVRTWSGYTFTTRICRSRSPFFWKLFKIVHITIPVTPISCEKRWDYNSLQNCVHCTRNDTIYKNFLIYNIH